MVAVPAFTAVTTPPSTVAIEASLVAQVTVLSVASVGVIVATSVVVSPSMIVAVSLSIEMPVTAITFFSTVTTQLAE